MLSEKRSESIFLYNKTKVSTKVIYFKGNKLYIYLTFINTSTLHIFPYASQKISILGNKKEIYMQTMTI